MNMICNYFLLVTNIKNSLPNSKIVKDTHDYVILLSYLIGWKNLLYITYRNFKVFLLLKDIVNENDPFLKELSKNMRTTDLGDTRDNLTTYVTNFWLILA